MPTSALLNRLPAIYGDDPFLAGFLAPFEQILLGPTSDGSSLSEIVSGLSAYLDPMQAPAEFLGWLSGWVALNLRSDLSEAQSRNFIANAVPLYRLRGTKAGLEKFLFIYTGLAPTITEPAASTFQIGVHSTVGLDTYLSGGPPHFFQVLIRIAQPDPVIRASILRIATAIVEAQKPAHTTYDLSVETPSLQIGVHSTLGVDTVLDAKSQ
jgi:phage tail-like protein